ncbi:hypothetical protein K1T71_005173 [Dendrolimus kikuchii]|uniref:Uncharacterized protein n=1 Tax=Dendrolimus kikuchii TaxID=765133 RepID=A0ACC1D686_9NEOP|nr:hypothetical protein K1T71_005173 [Dendrolimus kikuchii]
MDGTLPELEKLEKKPVDNSYSESIDDTRYENAPIRRQTLISFGVFMLTLGAGATSGISAILIPQLKHANGKSKFSTELVSWVAAISCLALFFGNLLSGYLMDRFGRRISHLMLTVCFVLGWAIIGFANDLLYLILLGRFITGICQGWLGPLGPVFVGEITAPIYRGFFLAALSLGIAVGVFLSHLFGTFMHWTTASLLCGLFPLTGGVIVYFAPESPMWLASKDRIDECITSFQWYRGKSPEMKIELDKIIDEQTKRDNSKGKLETLKTNIKKPEFWKPLLIMIIFFVICQLSGVNVICAYTTDMMKVLIGSNTSKSNTYIAMLSIDVLRCVSLVVACVLLRRLGRRPMALFSGVFTTLSLVGLALYLYLVDKEVVHNISPVISLGLMALYIVVSNMGISLLPWNMVGELFAVETKGIGSGISVMMTSLAFFGTVKTAPGMFQSIGHHGTYLFYGLCTLFGTVFLYFCLPETKNKTLLQIEEYFRYGKKKEIKNGKETGYV